MGADLYINKLRRSIEQEWRPKFDAAVRERDAATDEQSKAAAQKKVEEAYDTLNGPEHYFRDSYNGTSVLHRLGLSWWQDLSPDVEYVEGDPATEINVSVKTIREFRNKVAAAVLKPATRKELEAEHCTVDDGENSPDAWNQMFQEKRERLISFLDRAIQQGGMYASC